jgi:hypothetical protein
MCRPVTLSTSLNASTMCIRNQVLLAAYHKATNTHLLFPSVFFCFYFWTLITFCFRLLLFLFLIIQFFATLGYRLVCLMVKPAVIMMNEDFELFRLQEVKLSLPILPDIPGIFCPSVCIDGTASGFWCQAVFQMLQSVMFTYRNIKLACSQLLQVLEYHPYVYDPL